MPEDIFVVKIHNIYGAGMSIYESKDEADKVAERLAAAPNVRYTEVRKYDTTELLMHALCTIEDSDDEEEEDGELVSRFE